MRLSWSWKTSTIINKKAAWKKLALLLFAWLFTLTELRAITVTTFIPPKKPLTIGCQAKRLHVFVGIGPSFLWIKLVNSFNTQQRLYT
jgi:hypothetical protein